MATVTATVRRTAESDATRQAWADLREQGYALVRDTDLGLDGSREHFGSRYFGGEVLEADHEAIHKDRDRARDVIRYEWTDARLSLAEHPTVTISNRGGYAGGRDHQRVELLADPVAARWVEAALTLVSPEKRERLGTFGVNFFRTRTTVVSGPHRDGERYCLVYVVDKIGAGAQTRLHLAADPDRIAFRRTLAPGDMLLFDDEAYLHDVTPLLDTPTSPCRRDAIVCTVNYTSTYEV